MPRNGSNYPAQLLSLITSTTYPSPPSLEGLEALQAILHAQAASAASRLAEHDPIERERLKRERKDKKRKEREDRDEGGSGGNEGGSERAMLEANERAGQRLEAVVSQRVGQFTAPPGPSKKGTPSSVKVKRERTSLSPAPSNASSASFRPQNGSQPITYAGQLKKKKRKAAESDDESREHRSATLDLPSHTTTSGLKVKLAANKARPLPDPSPTPPTGIGAGIDFSLPNPPSRPLIPPRPGVQRPPKPGPKRQSEVDEDYSNTKAPTQVNFPTWWNTVEPYIRDLREDDLAILTLKADAPESYEIPPRGRHYTEVWDEEDGVPGSNPRVSVPNMRPGVTGHWVASDIRDEHLVEEHRGLGPLTERLVAAMISDTDEQEEKPGADMDERPQRVDVMELEDRVKKELRSLMLLGEQEEYDPSHRDDDEITSAIRQCQRLLLQQTTLNEARKARLAEIAKHRLAYGEYMSALEGIEKSVEASWGKRIKKYGLGKKGASSAQTMAANSARPPVPDGLKRLVAVRKEWLDTVGTCMKERPRGEVLGLPKSSVYEGILGLTEEEERDEKAIEEVLEPDDGMEVEQHA